MNTNLISVLLIYFIASIFLLSQGCVLDSVTKVAESGAKAYSGVKNANSIGDVASGVETLAKTREIKAETSKIFVEGIGKLIANQPIQTQKELIKQSIQAKVEIAENTRFRGFIEGILLATFLYFIINILKFMLNKWIPAEVTKKW